MSGTLRDAEVSIEVPAGWYRMPDPEADGAELWPFEVVGRFGWQGPDATHAFAALLEALALARSQAKPKRQRWVLLGEPAVPAVQGWALLDLVPRAEPDPGVAADTYEHGARAAGATGGDAAVWHREIARVTVHGDPAVVIHDLLTVGETIDTPGTMQHRAVVALFPAEPVLFSLSVSTPYLAALPDVEAAALDFADGVRIVTS